MRYDAVVLAGGRAQRLGGTRKDTVVLAGRAMVDHVLDAVAGAQNRVVVGPPPPGAPGAPGLTGGEASCAVPRVLEDPPFGGPVAGVAAGLDHLDAVARDEGTPAPFVAVLACDVPRVGRLVPALLAAADAREDGAAERVDGAWAVDREGRAQPLVAVVRRSALRARLDALAVDGGVRDVSARRLLDGLRMVEVPDPDGAAEDADTWVAVTEAEAQIRAERAWDGGPA